MIIRRSHNEAPAYRTPSGYQQIQAIWEARGDDDLWLAGHPVEVSEDEVVSWANSALMCNFESKALGKTFDF